MGRMRHGNQDYFLPRISGLPGNPPRRGLDRVAELTTKDTKLRHLAGVSEAGARCRNPERSEGASSPAGAAFELAPGVSPGEAIPSPSVILSERCPAACPQGSASRRTLCFSAVPTGLGFPFAAYPALPCRAIVSRPVGAGGAPNQRLAAKSTAPGA